MARLTTDRNVCELPRNTVSLALVAAVLEICLCVACLPQAKHPKPSPFDNREQERTLLEQLRADYARLKRDSDPLEFGFFQQKWCGNSHNGSRNLVLAPGIVYDIPNEKECQSLKEIGPGVADAAMRDALKSFLGSPTPDALARLAGTEDSLRSISLLLSPSEAVREEVFLTTAMVRLQLEYDTLENKELVTVETWLQENRDDPGLTSELLQRAHADVLRSALALPPIPPCTHLFAVQEFVGAIAQELDEAIWTCTTAEGTFSAYERYLSLEAGQYLRTAWARAQALDPSVDYAVLEAILSPEDSLPRGATSLMRSKARAQVLATRGAFEFQRFEVHDVIRKPGAWWIIGMPEYTGWYRRVHSITVKTTASNATTLLRGDIIAFRGRLVDVSQQRLTSYLLTFTTAEIVKQPKLIH